MTLVQPRPRIPPDAPPDGEALFREARRRRRRRRLAWSSAIVLVVTIGVILGSTLGPRHARPPSSGHTPPRSGQEVGASTPPSTIVAWTADESIAVLSTRTGRIERTLATHVSVFAPGDPTVSVAPGGTVFFDSAQASDVLSRAAVGDQILSVSIKGGPVRDIGPGSDPQVSPDGRTLAYISGVPAGAAGEAPYLVPPVGIDLASLSPADRVTAVRSLRPGSAQINRGASDLSWSSNSKQLSFDLFDPQTLRTSAWTVATGSRVGSLAAAVQIPLRQPGLTWNGYFGAEANGNARGIGVISSRSGNEQTIVTIDATTGRITQRLFSLPAAVCTQLSPNESGACSSDFANPLVGDPKSSSVLVAGVIPFSQVAPTPLAAASLYVWRPALRKPVRLAGHVVVASWGPAATG